MAYIRVDIDTIRQTIGKLESTIQELNNTLEGFNTEVVDMNRFWRGEDYDQYASEVRELMDYDSVHKRLIQALESYKRYLEDSKTLYERARQNAINRANWVRF